MGTKSSIHRICITEVVSSIFDFVSVAEALQIRGVSQRARWGAENFGLSSQKIERLFNLVICETLNGVIGRYLRYSPRSISAVFQEGKFEVLSWWDLTTLSGVSSALKGMLEWCSYTIESSDDNGEILLRIKSLFSAFRLFNVVPPHQIVVLNREVPELQTLFIAFVEDKPNNCLSL